jgi:hypothetical protein
MGSSAMLKWLVFVCSMTAVVEGYCWFLSDILRKLLDDPARYFFTPITVVVVVVFALLYPVLKPSRRPLTRIFILYFAFVAANAAYGVYLWFVAAHGTPLLIVLALVAGHLYGIPLLALIVLTDLLLAHLVFARLDRRAVGP